MATDIRLKESLPLLTERIVDTYAEVGGISHLGHCPLPNYDTIIAVTEDLRENLSIPAIAAATDCTWATSPITWAI